ncbi:uncharacterized protein LOC62_01G000603 [Vanrija pseudolonga]|uniref:Uncharacterized protein n=1 Tax=Vanrija pseudolonga TaxID=143232 RepID=A0AAF0Y5D3_9TREE|nr:hypothetical protein LOC62_01G000603 [Vanrija pseudolonga]
MAMAWSEPVSPTSPLSPVATAPTFSRTPPRTLPEINAAIALASSSGAVSEREELLVGAVEALYALLSGSSSPSSLPAAKEPTPAHTLAAASRALELISSLHALALLHLRRMTDELDTLAGWLDAQLDVLALRERANDWARVEATAELVHAEESAHHTLGVGAVVGLGHAGLLGVDEARGHLFDVVAQARVLGSEDVALHAQARFVRLGLDNVATVKARYAAKRPVLGRIAQLLGLCEALLRDTVVVDQ